MSVGVLTYDRAVELAEEVVAEFGEDYVYPQDHKDPGVEPGDVPMCVYVHEGKPSCLAGQILHRHGVSLEALSLNEGVGAWGVSAALAQAQSPAREFLLQAQRVQDQGGTWGKAVQQGKDYAQPIATR